ncbi:MAG: glycosyltransferase family 2 protein [Solirubrobacteraceae bacterium]
MAIAPRVTVVIPAWDSYVSDRLIEAVDSVQAQAIPTELIVVDNASAVRLPQLPCARVVRLARRCSLGAARNAALAHVRTPYVVFLDADDVLLPGALDALVKGVQAERGRALYVLSILDAATGRRHRSPRRLARAVSRHPRVFALANSVWSLLPTQGCAIMRTADVLACGGYAACDHGEDWVLGTSLAFRGSVAFDRRLGLRYRTRPDSPGSGPLSGRVLVENARRVRARIRADPAIPKWERHALPLIAVAQWGAARLAHPIYRSVREFHLAGTGIRSG